MKKLFISVLLTFSVAAPVFAADAERSERIAELKEQIAELQAELDELQRENKAYEKDGLTYRYLKHEVSGDYVNIYFEFSNNSGKPVTPVWGLIVHAYQNGEELTNTIQMSNVPEFSNTWKEAPDGTVEDIAYSFKISDLSDVEIKISPIISFEGVEPYEFTLSLQ